MVAALFLWGRIIISRRFYKEMDVNGYKELREELAEKMNLLLDDSIKYLKRRMEVYSSAELLAGEINAVANLAMTVLRLKKEPV